MKKRVLAAVFICIMTVSTLAGTATAEVDGGCSNGKGWIRFQVFIEDVFQQEAWLAAFPTNAAALADGIYTIDALEAGLDALDRNDNGWLCVKDVYGKNGMHGQGFRYYVSGVDDNAAR